MGVINYVVLNQLFEDFGKCFVSQQELSAKQAFWLQTTNPNTEKSDIPVRIKSPGELPNFNCDWGFEHTKAVFVNEINPFLKTLKDIFNVFDKDLINEDIMLNVMNSTTAYGDSVNLEMQSSESCDKCFDLDDELLKKQIASRDNQNALEILEYFKNNDLKAQLQAKDTTIRKLKEHIISIRENDKEEKVKQDIDEIETINIELEH
ncbi:hypothetical protein Tco_1422531, partial [Tanacetum coccineum]